MEVKFYTLTINTGDYAASHCTIFPKERPKLQLDQEVGWFQSHSGQCGNPIYPAHNIVLILVTNAIFIDELANFLVFRNVHTMLSSEYSVVQHADSQGLV